MGSREGWGQFRCSIQEGGELTMKIINVLKKLCPFWCCAIIAVFSAGTGYCFQVDLTIDERSGVGRSSTPVTVGVPFPRGMIFSDQDVQIAGQPAQFNALSTWPDGSVKWILCDFQGDVSANGNATYYLTDGTGNASGTPLSVSEDADSIVVVTGPLKFVVSKTDFNLFHRLWLDLNEDGSYTTDEQMISAHPHDGAIVTDDAEQQFHSSLDADVTVELEEVGPMRVAILAEGWHRDGSGQRKLDFTIRIHAYSDKSLVRVFHTFYNRQSTSVPDYIDVKDISLRSHINLQGAASYAFGGSGGTVHSGNLSGTESAYIYGYGTVTPGDLHYIIGGGSGGAGGKADGWADISDSRWGLTTGIRQFWQHHPKGIQVSADGDVWVRLLPRYYDSFPIDPGDSRTAADRIYCGAAKTHEVLYYFHAGNHTQASSEAVAQSFEDPLYAVAPPHWYTSSGAFGRILPQDLSYYKPEYQWLVQEWEDHIAGMFDVILLNRENSGWTGKNEYGMWNYGDSWQGQWSNMHYDAPYSLYRQFARTGDLKWFDLAADQCRHYRDVDIIYHVGDQTPGSLGEAGVGAARGRPNENHNLGIHDHGFTVLKGPGLILHYFLTGDRQSLYGGKMQADFVRNATLRYAQDLVLYDARFLGQALQAVLWYYQASGDQTYLDNGLYHLGDMDGSQKASAYTLAMKINEYQSVSPMYPDVWSIWQHKGCDCDDGFRCWKYGGVCIGSSWQSGNAWEALIHYYDITLDPTAREDILRGVHWMVNKSNLWTNDLGGYFLGYEPGHPEPGGVSLAGMHVGVLGFAFGETGNIDYLERAISALHVSVTYGSATTDPKLFAQKTRTAPLLFYYLSAEHGVQDTIPPNPPTGLYAADATEHSISLAWTPPGLASDGDGAYAYNVYRDGVPVGTPQAAQFLDAGLPEDTAFDYAVYSVDNAGNPSLTAATGSFSTLSDSDPPTISSANLYSPTTLGVVFSEPVEESSAEDILNYAIDNGIVVLGASLGGDLSTVTLTTGEHLEGVTYTLTVNGVRDRATIPNTIAPNSTASYQLSFELEVSNINRPTYVTAELVEGDQYYVDRNYTVVDIPGQYEGSLWIKTANDDKYDTSEEFLSFTVNQNVTVYVGFDLRAVSLPTWVTGDFTSTGDGIGVSDVEASPLGLWSRDFPAGDVVLGGNMASGASGAGSMYVVLLRGQGAVPDTADTVAPVISQVDADDISDTAATISWMTDEPSDSQVEYGLDTNYGMNSPLDSVLTLSHQVIISLPPPASKSFPSGHHPDDLRSGEKEAQRSGDSVSPTTGDKGDEEQIVYHYRVLSQDSFANLAISEDHTFTVVMTSEDTIAPQITNLEVSSVIDTSAQVSWETDEPTSAVLEYGLAEGEYQWSLEHTSLATTHQFLLIGLTPATTYHFRAGSSDQTGNWTVTADTTLVTRHPLPMQPGKPQHYDD
jgi:chitodextrinase